MGKCSRKYGTLSWCSSEEANFFHFTYFCLLQKNISSSSVKDFFPGNSRFTKANPFSKTEEVVPPFGNKIVIFHISARSANQYLKLERKLLLATYILIQKTKCRTSRMDLFFPEQRKHTHDKKAAIRKPICINQEEEKNGRSEMEFICCLAEAVCAFSSPPRLLEEPLQRWQKT